ncbi:uncharacterized protein KQ657_003299 [Scheffersomyces spartinae]|uniref:Vacuolar membrane protein n=1 Tax=Scheffersomyces spartinae TaxID=45513 RepID=A0A9P7VDY6_9ASCO|nr:uncharacterized protein KQ657_003299 [Scheffersomyces spartinae]KAG7195536.1 hypothetical protein KQ657_003299 [Scheffersomyces spartinae]
MPIALPENDDDRLEQGLGPQYERTTTETNHEHSVFLRLLNCLRIYNIPMINFVIMMVLGFFLFKLTTKYTGLYMKSSLVTIIVTNLVLYGVSETLAQSILSYKPDQPLIGFRLFDDQVVSTFSPRLPRFLFMGNSQYGPENTRIYNDDGNNDDEVEDDDEGIDRFLDYLRGDNDEIRRDYNASPLSPVIELSFYLFSRLAGFMCWGFVMSFAQCWWYKFLQIYSRDPKFIEVLRKVMTDQFCFSPISLCCFFTYGTIVLEGGTIEDVKEKLKRIYLKTLLLNYTVWFPVQFMNFLVVPRDFQVPFSSSVSLLWNCFLSIRNSKG